MTLNVRDPENVVFRHIYTQHYLPTTSKYKLFNHVSKTKINKTKIHKQYYQKQVYDVKMCLKQVYSAQCKTEIAGT